MASGCFCRETAQARPAPERSEWHSTSRIHSVTASSNRPARNLPARSSVGKVSVPVVWFASNAIPISVETLTIARLASVKRGCAGGASLGTAGIIDAVLDPLPFLGRHSSRGDEVVCLPGGVNAGPDRASCYSEQRRPNKDMLRFHGADGRISGLRKRKRSASVDYLHARALAQRCRKRGLRASYCAGTSSTSTSRDSHSQR